MQFSRYGGGQALTGREKRKVKREKRKEAGASHELNYKLYRRDSPCGCPLTRLYIKFAADRGEPRRRLLRIVRNSLWLSLTHYATPPLPQKSRSARLFGCKRPHDGSLSLPTFAVVRECVVYIEQCRAGLAPAERISKYITAFGCYQIEFNIIS